MLDFTLIRAFKRDNPLAVSWLFRVTCDKPKVSVQPHLRDRAHGFRRTCTVSYVNMTLPPSSPSTLSPQGFESLHSSTQAQHNWFNASFWPSLSAEHVGPSCTPAPLLATLNSQPPAAHSFLSVVLQPRREKKQVLLNRQAEQVDREAVPETRVTQRLWSHKQRCSYFPIPPSDLEDF